MKKLLLAALVGAVALLPLHAAWATKPDPDHKVTICHRTHSATNPYVRITVDEASINGDLGDDHGQGDHQTHNEGPVPDPATYENFAQVKANGGWWGDIIPPFYENGDAGYWNALNWDAAGQAVFNNGCDPVGEPPSAAGSVDIVPGTCESPLTTVSALNTGEVDLIVFVLRSTDGGQNYEALTSETVVAGGSYSGTFAIDLGTSAIFSVELWNADNELDSTSATTDLTNCSTGEVAAALTQGTCDAAAFVTLFNTTDEAADFTVNGDVVSVPAQSQQNVEVAFGDVTVTSGEVTLLSDTAAEPTDCKTTPPPPPNPPTPPTLPETL